MPADPAECGPPRLTGSARPPSWRAWPRGSWRGRCLGRCAAPASSSCRSRRSLPARSTAASGRNGSRRSSARLRAGCRPVRRGGRPARARGQDRRRDGRPRDHARALVARRAASDRDGRLRRLPDGRRGVRVPDGLLTPIAVRELDLEATRALLRSVRDRLAASSGVRVPDEALDALGRLRRRAHPQPALPRQGR